MVSTRPQLAVWAVFLSALALPGCFAPVYEEGLACSESGECPGDLRCVTNRCVGPNFIGRYDSGIRDEIDATPACEAGSETFEATGAIVDFTVPSCITSITIEAFGAEGGGGEKAAVLGGKGARMKGDFTVDEGDVLQLLVGGRGADAVRIGTGEIAAQGGGSGGGGSFVVDAAGTALIVAGGGGGATHNTIGKDSLIPGGDGTSDTNGQAGGDEGGDGGTDGGGGGLYSNTAGFHSGTGGGGFSGPGVGSSDGGSSNGTPNAPGSSFLEGGAGGVAGSEGRNGGFGGGGSAGFTGGGGGGYSGGGGAGGGLFADPHAGGGGGSINTGTTQDNSPGVRTGDGQVIIVWSP